jgi:hypothetical protein
LRPVFIENDITQWLNGVAIIIISVLIKPRIVPIEQAFQKFMANIIFDSTTFKKTKSVKTEREKGKRFLPSTGDNKKLIARIPATTTARYIAVFQEASISVFRKMLRTTATIKASTTIYKETMYKVPERPTG